MNYKDMLFSKLTPEDLQKLDDSTLIAVLKARKERNSAGLYDFDGWNCDDLEDNTCGGWDGESRRCECGNRRVYWDMDDSRTYVFGTAY